ncbi:MAG: NBR1-Ig-like domain-containing protein [Anaerolineales bacterium]
MLKKRAALHAFSKTLLVVLVLTAFLAACAPAQSADQIQAQVETSVAMTVQAQGQMAAAVASTLTAQAPQATAVSSPTAVPLDPPTLPPTLATVTPFVVVPPGGGGSTGSTQPLYGCTYAELKPTINLFKPGDPFDILYYIKNIGTKDWPSKKDLNYVSGTRFTSVTWVELPPLKSGETTTVSFDANAPKEPGNYEMRWKVEGGLCFPATDIQVGKPRDP